MEFVVPFSGNGDLTYAAYGKVAPFRITAGQPLFHLCSGFSRDIGDASMSAKWFGFALLGVHCGSFSLICFALSFWLFLEGKLFNFVGPTVHISQVGTGLKIQEAFLKNLETEYLRRSIVMIHSLQEIVNPKTLVQQRNFTAHFFACAADDLSSEFCFIHEQHEKSAPFFWRTLGGTEFVKAMRHPSLRVHWSELLRSRSL